MNPKHAREFVQRQHRVIGLIAVFQCWFRGLDGIILERWTYTRLCGTSTIQDTRVEWMCEDLSEFFPNHRVERNRAPGWTAKDPFRALYLARKSLKRLDISKCDPRDGEIYEGYGLRLASLNIWPRHELRKLMSSQVLEPLQEDDCFEQRFIASQMALLSQGCISPKSLLYEPKPKSA